MRQTLRVRELELRDRQTDRYRELETERAQREADIENRRESTET